MQFLDDGLILYIGVHFTFAHYNEGVFEVSQFSILFPSCSYIQIGRNIHFLIVFVGFNESHS